MKAKLNYILGGILALSFSLVASTGVLMLNENTHSAGLFASCLQSALPLMRKVHIIVGLILIALVAYHIIRNWDFIVCMTELLRQEREVQSQNPEKEAHQCDSESEAYEEIDEADDDDESYDDERTSEEDDDSPDGRGNQSSR